MNSADKHIFFEEIEKRYGKRPGVLGVAVFGSFVRGSFDAHSDIDVYVLKKKKPLHAREGYSLRGIRIDVTLDGEKDAKRFLKQERNSVRRIFSHMLAHGKILCEAKGSLSALQRLATENLRGKTSYSRDEIIMHLYSIDDFYGEVARFAKMKDAFAFEQSVALFINNAIECFLKIKGTYLRRPNELEGVLRKLDPAFARAVQGAYRARAVPARVRHIAAAKRRIEALAHGSLPEKWAVR